MTRLLLLAALSLAACDAADSQVPQHPEPFVREGRVEATINGEVWAGIVTSGYTETNSPEFLGPSFSFGSSPHDPYVRRYAVLSIGSNQVPSVTRYELSSELGHPYRIIFLEQLQDQLVTSAELPEGARGEAEITSYDAETGRFEGWVSALLVTTRRSEFSGYPDTLAVDSARFHGFWKPLSAP